MWLFLMALAGLMVVGSGLRAPFRARKHSLLMSTTAEGEKKLGKVEAIKVRSNYLNDPLKEVVNYLLVCFFVYFMLFRIY